MKREKIKVIDGVLVELETGRIFRSYQELDHYIQLYKRYTTEKVKPNIHEERKRKIETLLNE